VLRKVALQLGVGHGDPLLGGPLLHHQIVHHAPQHALLDAGADARGQRLGLAAVAAQVALDQLVEGLAGDGLAVDPGHGVGAGQGVLTGAQTHQDHHRPKLRSAHSPLLGALGWAARGP
jgi:hypothetical protein